MLCKCLAALMGRLAQEGIYVTRGEPVAPQTCGDPLSASGVVGMHGGIRAWGIVWRAGRVGSRWLMYSDSSHSPGIILKSPGPSYVFKYLVDSLFSAQQAA